MNRTYVAEKPKVGMYILFHRRDGLWLLKVTNVDINGYVSYHYKLYKGEGNVPSENMDTEMLIDVLYYRTWKTGGYNSPDTWAEFIIGNDSSYSGVRRVEYSGGVVRKPNWEV